MENIKTTMGMVTIISKTEDEISTNLVEINIIINNNIIINPIIVDEADEEE